MKDLKNFNFLLPYLKIFMKIIGILIIIFSVYIVGISFMDPEKIQIKNSNRRKINEKIDKDNINKENMFLKRRNQDLKSLNNKINSNIKNFFAKE
jgi:hypothetical protein